MACSLVLRIGSLRSWMRRRVRLFEVDGFGVGVVFVAGFGGILFLPLGWFGRRDPFGDGARAPVFAVVLLLLSRRPDDGDSNGRGGGDLHHRHSICQCLGRLPRRRKMEAKNLRTDICRFARTKWTAWDGLVLSAQSHVGPSS